MRDPRQDGRPFATQESANGSSRTSADGDPYRSLVERMPAITYIDAWQGGATVEISPQIERILGFPRQSWVGNEELWSERIHPEDRDRVRAETLVARESGEPYHTEYRMIAADGRVVWFRDEATLVRDQRSNPMFWQGVMLDVTELRRAEEQVHAANERYRALVEQIPAIIYVDVVDEAMTTSYVSPQIEEILGFTPEEYVEDAGLWYEQLHPDDRDRALGEYLAGRDSGQPFTFEYRLLARDGRVVWFRDSAVVLCDHEGRPEFVRGVMLDITEERKAEEEAAFIAYHDKLTGLPNRAMFDELLELALARGRRHGLSVAVLCLDVDDFKLVNDSLGHEAGDQLIRVLGDRLREATRETDLVARQGGDEFLLLLADLEVDTEDGTDPGKLVAESVAMRIQEMLRTPFEVGGTELYVTASIGISLFPGDADTASALLKNADAAMYQSKAAAPGGYVMFADRSDDALEKLAFSTRLRKAVENQNWTLHYQPIIELASGQTVGVEALLRWQDPNGGLIPPGEFIPLAEEMGLIEVIGEWVVEELARQDQRWRREGLDLEVSFNLSPRQLRQPHVGERLLALLDGSGVDPRNVVVEITESTAMTDPDRTLRTLRDLHSRGLRLAIDDFGTGYSSLARLRDMPVEILKIDRSFVRGVATDHDAKSMVRAIIQLAENLGKVPLAEGIETEDEWQFLVEHGCRLGQGYFFSKPVPAGEIESRQRGHAAQAARGPVLGSRART